MLPYSTEGTRDSTDAPPIATIGLVVACFVVFLYELTLSDGQLTTFINAYSLVPCEYTGQCVAYPGTPTPFWLTLFSSMFLHAGWEHIVGNMMFLLIFGTHVERAMGPLRFLVFYVACGLGASALEILTSLGSSVPGLGASGAVSGVLAGYLVLFPGSHVRSLVPLGIFWWTARIPAWAFIGAWFLYQVVLGLTSVPDAAGGGVAYSAHIGGFITGLLLVRALVPQEPVDRLRALRA